MEFKKKTIIWEENNEPPKNYIWVKDDGKAYEYDYTTRQWVESETIYVLLAQVDNISDLITILASDEHTFSSDKDYSAGETVLKEGKLYTFTKDHAAGEWNEEEVEETSILDILDVSSNKMINITWAKLKDLRDNSKLVPGALYRITDYVTTTAQDDTRSAGHQFDVIVQAISESVLSEDARAIQHKFGIEDMPQVAYSSDNSDVLTKREPITIDSIKYCVYTPESESYKFLVDLNDPIYEGNNDDSYQYAFWPNYSINNEGIIDSGIDYGESICFKQDLREFSYFSNSNLAAWKLKYCLDNDDVRFTWAQQQLPEGIELDCEPGIVFRLREKTENFWTWISEKYNILNDTNAYILTRPNPTVGLSVTISNYDGPDPYDVGNIASIVPPQEGKGVIYQMTDEHGNNCPYDFKNIQINVKKLCTNSRYISWTEEVGFDSSTNINFYTFSDKNGEDASLSSNGVYSNIIEKSNIANKQCLNNIVMVGTTVYGNKFFYGCNDIFIGDTCTENVFVTDCSNLTIGNNFRKNVCREFTNSSVQYVGIGSCEIRNLDVVTISTADVPAYYYLVDSLIYFGESAEITFEVDENHWHKIICVDNNDSILITEFYKIFSAS